MIQWVRRQRDENTLIYRIVMNDCVYLAISMGWIVTGLMTGWYF